MRIYSEADEEALRARKLLKDWAGEGFLSEAQYRTMEEETVCGFRLTNIFLRYVLLLFTLIIVGAAVGLCIVVFLPGPSTQGKGVFLLICAVLSYAAAEFAVARFRLYRYGIEEALVVCSVVFLCVGIDVASFRDSLIPAAGAILSLWIWWRFGLFYAFLAAMIFVAFLPGYWTSSPAWQHRIVSAFYSVGGGCVALIRSRRRFDYRDEGYSLAEAFLLVGIYLTINLQLSSLNLHGQWLPGLRVATEFSKSYYWFTWVMIWFIPAGALIHSIRRKDRFVIIAGGICAVLTLVTNKPYLGWEKHTWDPMLLGVLLIGLAVFARRWLARGSGGTRHGFTAERLSGRDKQWMSAAASGLGLVTPQAITPALQSPGIRFGGGDSGGGGATGDF